MYPASRILGRCHPICRKGSCFLELQDFLIERQTWWATPGKHGIIWKLAEAVPTTLHDLMLHFDRSKAKLKWFPETGMNKGRIARKEAWTKAPSEILKLKVKNRKYHSRRPCKYQYFPTHWAMVDFLKRNPDALERLNGEVPLWKPIRIRREKTLVKFSPIILPRTPVEKREKYEKMMKRRAELDRRIGYPLPTLPPSGP
jgi:hypothetical protein